MPSAAFSLLGHKGDLMLIHFRNGFDERRIEIHPPVPRMGDAALRSNFSPRNLILYAGQIIRGKGVDVLLRALALIESLELVEVRKIVFTHYAAVASLTLWLLFSPSPCDGRQRG